MISILGDDIALIWDLKREHPTIGGALVLRKEGEILAQILKVSRIIVYLICDDINLAAADELTKRVFCSSVYVFEVKRVMSIADGWPSSLQRAHPDFSYFSFSRITELYTKCSVKPILHWSKYHLGLAQQARAMFSANLVCVHLRNLPPYLIEESNADGAVWQNFFNKHAVCDECDFLLIGDDPLPEGLTIGNGVSRACDIGLDLTTQLALVGIASGFLGMASGLCTAANLSNTPHVIFKHPFHHSSEMARELGSAVHFPFSLQHQQLWRRPADSFALDQAFQLISS